MPPSHTPKKRRKLSNLKKTLIILLAALLGFAIWFLYIMDGLRIFLPYYPWLSGLPFQTKNYLVVLQNDAELRPGGGFMTAYGVVHFAHGVPTGFEIMDVFALSEDETEYIPAPYPMEDLLKSPFYKGWAFQDSNWFADFETNAEKMIWFYNRKFPDQHIDGVVALNFNVIEDLIDIIGSVKAEGLSLDRENLFTQLEYRVSNIDRHNIEDLKNRKNILRSFYSELVKKVIFSPLQYHRISKMLLNNLSQKNIQIYFTDPLLENVVERRGWDGQLQKPQQNDYLAVVEANLGGMKSDRYIERHIEYHVDLDEKNATANLKITFTHRGDFNEPLSYTYKGFIRILIPKDATLLKKEQGLVEGEESGLKFVGEKLEIEPQTSKTVEFSYVLPKEAFQNNQYTLHINKQSGTNDFYTVTVHAPHDFVLKGEDWDFRDNLAVYKGILTKDIDLALTIEKDMIPPRATFQIFKDLQTLEIHFNEAVDPKECARKENYSIVDTNVKNPVTDTVEILDIECGQGGLTMKIQGATRQELEQYKMTMRNIRDIYGNVISPNPRDITIVQRLEQQ